MTHVLLYGICFANMIAMFKNETTRALEYEYEMNKELELAKQQGKKMQNREVENWLRIIKRKKIEVYDRE